MERRPRPGAPGRKKWLKAEDARNRVVLPAPFIPISPLTCPAPIEKETWRRLAARQRDRQSVYHQRRAVGQTALFRAGWSPVLFTVLTAAPSKSLTSAACKRRPRPASTTGSGSGTGIVSYTLTTGT